MHYADTLFVVSLKGTTMDRCEYNLLTRQAALVRQIKPQEKWRPEEDWFRWEERYEGRFWYDDVHKRDEGTGTIETTLQNTTQGEEWNGGTMVVYVPVFNV